MVERCLKHLRKLPRARSNVVEERRTNEKRGKIYVHILYLLHLHPELFVLLVLCGGFLLGLDGLFPELVHSLHERLRDTAEACMARVKAQQQ